MATQQVTAQRADEAGRTTPAVAGNGTGPRVPHLTPAEAELLPAKLQWALVGWYRAAGYLAGAEAVLDVVARRGG